MIVTRFEGGFSSHFCRCGCRSFPPDGGTGLKALPTTCAAGIVAISSPVMLMPLLRGLSVGLTAAVVAFGWLAAAAAVTEAAQQASIEKRVNDGAFSPRAREPGVTTSGDEPS